MASNTVYLASIALEPERWSSRRPSFAFSEWCPAALEAGFDGIELWEYHYTLADEQERESLEQALARRAADRSLAGRELSAAWPAPPVFNTYALPTRHDRRRWSETIAASAKLEAAGIKFNLGVETARSGEYRDVLLELLSSLPAGIELWCECHPGTIVEQPEAAARFFESPGLEAVRFIIHPFLIGPAKLRRWFDALPGRITHTHCQMRDDDGHMLALASRPDYVAGRLDELRELGYTGSFSIEFVEGTGTTRDRPSHTFAAAVSDLRTLRTMLSGAG